MFYNNTEKAYFYQKTRLRRNQIQSEFVNRLVCTGLTQKQKRWVKPLATKSPHRSEPWSNESARWANLSQRQACAT